MDCVCGPFPTVLQLVLLIFCQSLSGRASFTGGARAQRVLLWSVCFVAVADADRFCVWRLRLVRACWCWRRRPFGLPDVVVSVPLVAALCGPSSVLGSACFAASDSLVLWLSVCAVDVCPDAASRRCAVAATRLCAYHVLFSSALTLCVLNVCDLCA